MVVVSEPRNDVLKKSQSESENKIANEKRSPIQLRFRLTSPYTSIDHNIHTHTHTHHAKRNKI